MPWLSESPFYSITTSHSKHGCKEEEEQEEEEEEEAEEEEEFIYHK